MPPDRTTKKNQGMMGMGMAMAIPIPIPIPMAISILFCLIATQVVTPSIHLP
jgi:hypothetical protein